MKMGHGSVYSRDQIFSLMLMKLGQNVCLDGIWHNFFKIGHVGSKCRSLGQMIENPMLVIKGL